jgi:hypothetical protein
MFRRLTSLVALALITSGALATASLAGGHVDIAATSVPRKIIAGQPAELTFSIRYPNGQAVRNAAPVVLARCGKEQVAFAAVATNKAGHYVASMTLPRQGEWLFVIDSKICGNTCTLSPMTALAAVTPAKSAKPN